MTFQQRCSFQIIIKRRLTERKKLFYSDEFFLFKKVIIEIFIHKNVFIAWTPRHKERKKDRENKGETMMKATKKKRNKPICYYNSFFCTSFHFFSSHLLLFFGYRIFVALCFRLDILYINRINSK